MRSFSRFGLGAVTAATMAIAAFPFTVFSVLAADLIGEFDISRAQLGVLGTAAGLVGAFVSPAFGRLTDRIGSLTATRGVLIVGSLTLIAFAVSPTYAVLIAAAVAMGAPNGWGNPAGNALIVDNVPVGSRGLVTGVKQAGVQVGAFLGGLFLPMLTGLWGWRVALALFVVMPLSGLVGTLGHRATRHHKAKVPKGEGRLPRSIYWIAMYGLVSGTGTSAVYAFLPLFAEEDLLWSAQAAGSLIAVIGLIGFFARIAWPTVSERSIGHGKTLRVQAVLSLVSGTLLALAAIGVLPSWALVPAALLLAVGSIAWNAVGMLAVMEFSPSGLVGKGTGIVLLGFLLGFGIGAPLMGLSVDAFGSYVPGWLTVAALMLISAVIAGRVPSRGTLGDS